MKRAKMKIARLGTISEKLIEQYRRLQELEAMDLPNNDPSRGVGGEMTMLEYEVHKALGISPLNYVDAESKAKLAELHAAAKLPRELQDRLDALERKREDEERKSEEHYILNGPHCWGWDRDEAFARFEQQYGYRPGEGDEDNENA